MNTLNNIAKHPLQTNSWATFRKEWGNEVLKTKYGLLTLHKIPFLPFKLGMFIRGPKPTKTMLKDLKSIALKEKLIFIKLEPVEPIKNKEKSIKLLKGSGAVSGKTLFTPTTFQVDLTPPEEELMKSFSSKTRYNIRLAQRKGVKVVEDNSKKAFESYLKLTRETVERQGFYAHSERYHRLMWKHLNKNLKQNPIARIMTASYKGDIITSWILFVWNNTLYYPYGASSTKHKNAMANNLVMWEVIRLGKNLGCTTFDLWGREVGKGFTKFKEGYNPTVVETLGTWDLVINKPLYRLYKLAEAIRWPLLRLRSKLVKPSF